MKSIHAYLEDDLRKWASRPYISVKSGQHYHAHTFSETIHDIRCLSRALLQLHLQGKQIMICADNSYEWIVLYLSITGYVGICVPVDKEWTAYDFAHTLSAIEISAVFYSRSCRERIQSLSLEHPEILWYCIEDCLPHLIQEGASSPLFLIGQPILNKTVMILFTSGTTNLPKAIPLTQENLFANWETLYRRTPMTEQDISYIFLPFHHVYTCVANILYTIISGMQLFLASDLTQVIPELIQIRPTVVCTVPLFLYRMYEAMDEILLDTLQNIRFLYCGGSFTDPKIKQYFIENGVCLLEAYGTSETSSVIALSVPGDPDLACNGVVFENLDVQILNPDAAGVGEIIVKGKSVSKGYLNRNDHYSEFDQDGSYHTGDLGYLDQSGHLYLKGRKKRMILTANGKNVYVDELEELILQDPQIHAVKVWEEDHHPAALVVSDLNEEAIQQKIQQINRLLPRYKQIRKIYQKPDTLGGRIK